MGCTTAISKFILFFFNFIFFCLGIAVVTAGALAMNNDIIKQLKDVPSSVLIAGIVFGAFLVMTSFFGCCGALMGSSWMLKTYAAILILILIAMAGIGIAAYVMKDKIDAGLKKDLQETMDKYNDEKDKGPKKLWDEVQKLLKCCGYESPKDWQKFTGFATSPPQSCCIKADSSCNYGKEQSHQEGCRPKVTNFIKNNVAIFAGVAIGLVVLLLLGVFASCYIARREDLLERMV